jgi:hypothetical protein
MQTRRAFLGQVGSGMFIAALGSTVARDLGLASERDFDDDGALPSLGRFEPLAQLLAETPLEELLPTLVARLRGGLPLQDLVAATALANARRCGGTDYNAYHAFMALVPSYEMAQQLDGPGAALPVLKVVRRNAVFMRAAPDNGRMSGEPEPHEGDLLALVRAEDLNGAEAALAQRSAKGAGPAWASVQQTVRDEADVHRVVLAWRAWDVRRLTGEEHAHILLRQIVRHCVQVERQTNARGQAFTSARTHVPALLEARGIGKEPLGDRVVDAAWVDGFARDVFTASCDDAATLIADALSQKVGPQQIGEALALAATRLVLHERGRTRSDEPSKPVGSMHGAGTGIHAADSVDAWQSIAAGGDSAHVAASLITTAYYVGGRARSVAGEPLATKEAELEHAEAAAQALTRSIEAGDQAASVAAARRLLAHEPTGERAHAVLLGYSCRQDGALHAEKFFRTQQAAFATARFEHRAEHLAALARVVASQQCMQADGVAEAEALLRA